MNRSEQQDKIEFTESILIYNYNIIINKKKYVLGNLLATVLTYFDNLNL